MHKNFSLIVRTPDKEVLNLKDVVSVKVTTEDGPIVVYSHHANLTGNMLVSPLRVKTNDTEQYYMLKRGVIFVDHDLNRMTILALSCEELAAMAFETVQEYLKSVDAKLKSGEPLSDVQLKYLEEEKLAVTTQMKYLKK